MIFYKVYYRSFCFCITNLKAEAEKMCLNKEDYRVEEVEEKIHFLNEL